MADTFIGKPVPRGMVDVEHDFVGIPENGMNEHRELARLRRQVASLRARIEPGYGLARGVSSFSISILAMGLAGLVFTAVLRRRRVETPMGRTGAALRHAWRHFR